MACGTSRTLTGKDELKDFRNAVVRTATDRIGAGYKYAGKGPGRFDCSGLVHYAYSRAGIVVPSSSASLSKLGNGIPRAKAQPGDLVFFKKNGRVFHVSIVTRAGANSLSVVHSTTSKGVIAQDVLASTYWKPKIHKVVSAIDIVNNR